MHWLLRVAGILVLTIASTEDAAACVSSDLSGIADSFRINSDGSDFANAAINGGIALWSGCSGYGSTLPMLTTTGSGDIVINVEFLDQSSTTSVGGCAEILRAKDSQTGELLSATIRLFATTSGGVDCTKWQAISMAHELGHAYGFKNSNCPGYIMAAPTSSTSIQPSECAEAATNYETSLEQPETNEGPEDPLNQDCEGGGCSPILMDVQGDGIHLSSAEEPISFDIDADGVEEWISWTLLNSDDGFLALDRNEDGRISDGRELFGNFTAQPDADEPNGFEALALFDRAELGGNGDGLISIDDAIYGHLLLWQDLNRDGLSQAQELTVLGDMGVVALDLDYIRTERRDCHGNRYRWRGFVLFGYGRQLAATDVIFVTP